MRHLKHKFQLGRKKEHRIALMSNLGAALLRHGKIQTTLPKAKALRPFVEKIITLAVKASASPERALHYRRQALSKIRDKEAVGILFNERASNFLERPGGYTRIYKLGTRIGDAAEMAVIQLIPAEDEGYPKQRRHAQASEAIEQTAESEAVEETVESTDDAVSDDTETSVSDDVIPTSPDESLVEDNSSDNGVSDDKKD
jgi:large subunit ribosomal protein L17